MAKQQTQEVISSHRQVLLEAAPITIYDITSGPFRPPIIWLLAAISAD